MKTTLTKLLVVAVLLTSQFVLAQTPLLPLFENNTIKWGASSYYKGTICDGNGSNDVSTFYEMLDDTIIDSKAYKVLSITSKTCYDRFKCGNISGQFCSSNISRKYLKQDGNLIIEVARDGSLIDTILHMESTSLGSKVKIKRTSFVFHVVSIDSIVFNDVKIRRFNLENSFGYLDGIGFDNNGPFASDYTYAIGDASSFLNCFTKDGNGYVMNRGNGSITKILSVNKSTAMCENPLSIDDKNMGEADLLKVFVNPNNQLETFQIASSIEIIDLKGQKMIQNKDAFKTDVSVLPNGIYIANITFANKVLKHKFLVND